MPLESVFTNEWHQCCYFFVVSNMLMSHSNNIPSNMTYLFWVPFRNIWTFLWQSQFHNDEKKTKISKLTTPKARQYVKNCHLPKLFRQIKRGAHCSVWLYFLYVNHCVGPPIDSYLVGVANFFILRGHVQRLRIWKKDENY